MSARTLPATFFLVVALLLPPPACGQDPGSREEEARTLASAETESMEAWAVGRLAGLDEAAPTREFLMERAWALYLLAVPREEEVAETQELLRGLRATLPDSSRLRPVAEALTGAVQVVRAKHAFWPPNKLKHLRRGLGTLDALVLDHPQDPAIRYLRLVSSYYLPFFLAREETVREDFQALARILAVDGGAIPSEIRPRVVSFVIQEGDLAPEERAGLEGLF